MSGDARGFRGRPRAQHALPLPPEELKALFDHLDEALSGEQCDHTRKVTRAWLEAHGHPVESVFLWLDGSGGFCDCEVLANSEQAQDEALRGA